MSETPGYQRFFAELKRRKVFRVMAVYGAAGFILLQVAELLVPALLLPEWTDRMITLFLIVGFPIAIILAWAFESTPDGVHRTEEASEAELAAIAAAPPGKRWPAGVMALAATGLFLGAVYTGLRSSDGGTAPTAADEAGRPPATETASQPAAAGTETEAAEASRQAVAVLPFADLAGTDESRAFALGLHDDLMTQLTQVPDLKVTSRTSVMVYADQNRPVEEIARELEVGSIVEGGVRTSGGRVRLNIQLVDPATDEHLWAQTFDEELTAENVFEIQGEIARAVATALEAELSDETGQALGSVQTDNIEAWSAYHRGKVLSETIGDSASEVRSATELARAVELDPEFIAARAGLVRAQSWLVRRGFAADTMPARRSLDELQALDPGGADALFAEGAYLYYAQADYPAALEALQRARALRPGDPEIMKHEGWVLRRLGRWPEAMQVLDQAVQLDPMNATLIWNQGANNYRLRRYGIGRAQYDMALDIEERSDAGGRLAELQLFSEGDSAAARRTVEAGRGFAYPGIRESAEFWLAYMARDYGAAIDIALSLGGEMTDVARASGSQRFHSRPLRLATVYRLAGDEASARAWADSAVAQAEAALESRPEPEPRDKFGVASVAHSHLGLALVLRGGPGDVERGIEHAEEAVRLHDYELDAADSAVGNWFLLRTYAVAGRTDEAIRQIEKMLSRPSNFSLGDLKLDPLYDELRQDPRWEGLVREAEGLVES